MVIQVRLDVPIDAADGLPARAEIIAREQARAMGVQVNRVKARLDVVQLYGSKEVAGRDAANP